MDKEILGVHHVTAIASDPQRNIDFYVGLLGLRLVKLTVNFDEPTTYHLYYGDELGHPGTILTFFAWPGGPNGRIGTGQLTTTSFSIPETAISFWMERLRSHNVPFQGPTARFNEQALSFSDPDGLQLELAATDNTHQDRVWKEGPVPPEYGLRGFHGVALSEASPERTSSLLTETMGFRRTAQNGNRFGTKLGQEDQERLLTSSLNSTLPEELSVWEAFTTSLGAHQTTCSKKSGGKSYWESA